MKAVVGRDKNYLNCLKIVCDLGEKTGQVQAYIVIQVTVQYPCVSAEANTLTNAGPCRRELN